MFAWAPIPEPYREMGSIEFAKMIVTEANVALSPGVGFGPGGDGHVRFALIENEQRIGQAVRNLKRALTKLVASGVNQCDMHLVDARTATNVVSRGGRRGRRRSRRRRRRRGPRCAAGSAHAPSG